MSSSQPPHEALPDADSQLQLAFEREYLRPDEFVSILAVNRAVRRLFKFRAPEDWSRLRCSSTAYQQFFKGPTIDARTIGPATLDANDDSGQFILDVTNTALGSISGQLRYACPLSAG